MPFPIHLRITEHANGDWRVTLGDRDTRPTEAVLRAEDVRAACREVASWLMPVPPVLVPGHDLARTAAEERAGQRLGALLQTDPALAAALGYQLGVARARRDPAVLVLDTQVSAARALPWELLAPGPGQPPLEATGDAWVARLAAGRLPNARSEAQQLRILRWCPEPDDPVCAALSEHLDRVLAELGVQPAVSVELDQALPEPEPGTAEVLHVIMHGRRVADQVRLVGAEGEQAPGTPSHLLAGRLAELDLVLLDVCHGGADTGDELQQVAARFVAAGAPACAAPRTRCGEAAAMAFSRGLYRTLAGGGALLEAVGTGRAAVRALAHPHPELRWANHALTLGDLRTVARPAVVQRRWRPAGWPVPGPMAAELLDGAQALSKRSGAGYIGLEHLSAVLIGRDGGGPVTAHVRFVLAHLAQRPGHQGLSPVQGRSPDLRGTPRLASYGRLLQPGFGLDALWRVICADPGHLLHLFAGPALAQAPVARVEADTLPDQGVEPELASMIATTLQVCGGPEDGRVLRPQVGDRVGRWHPEHPVEIPLYQHTVLLDPRLSRAHLTWVGPGKVLLRKEASLWRAGSTTSVCAEVALNAGDVLQLTAATRLRALA